MVSNGFDLANLPSDTGIMICGHGSRNQNAAKEFATLSEGLKARYPQCGHRIWLSGVLQSGHPFGA